jgi:hypothetical protein
MAQCTTNKTQYYKGESIPFYVNGDSIDNLDLENFKILFYSAYQDDIVISKSDMTNTDTNEYYYEISDDISKDLSTGDYTMEILLGDSSKSIWKGFAFNLADSHSKNYLV